MGESYARAKRHSDYVQIGPLTTPSPARGVPSIQTYASEELRVNLSELEPDGYIRISKEQAAELVTVIDDYVVRWGPLLEIDETLVTELRDVLDTWA